VTKDRPLPANVPAEKAILGAILLDNALFQETAVLTPDDFSLDAHRRIYHCIAQMIERGDSVDPITLVEDMRGSGDLNAVGNMPVAYIADLSADTIRYKQSVKGWTRIVKAKSLLRQLILCCSQAVKEAYDGGSGFEIISALKEHIEDIESAARRGMRKP
jgi:replicative DNA helicase